MSVGADPLEAAIVDVDESLARLEGLLRSRAAAGTRHPFSVSLPAVIFSVRGVLARIRRWKLEGRPEA